jgi:molecular chaperone HtpG
MTKDTYKFNAETDKVFKLMVHSLYENKDIFIRELISNASDACDKLRYEAIAKPELVGSDELKITIEIDKKNRVLKFSDNGVGMNKQSLIDNLGTIARSGTQRFLESMTGDSKKDSQLIGQFGVGFYSCFMIADNVTAISQAAGEDKAYIWNSNGEGDFTVEEAGVSIGRGTQISLHIKEGEDEYLDRFRVKSIIESYSNHIAFKIAYLEENGAESIINDGKAIWLKAKSEVSDEDYQEFYESISGLGDDKPWLTLHNKAEGVVEYTNLLFVPNRKPFDLFHPDRLTRVRLYIKRVLISEKISIIPQYLRFMRGVIDSNDLPLNISRETVQNNAQVQKIKTSVTKRVLKELARKSENDREDYLKFWDNFGAVLKEGLCDGNEPRDEILDACLFQINTDEKLYSLKEIRERLKENQKSIYYITAESRENALSSPQIEGFVARGYDVILLTDSVDDFWVNVIFDYQGVPVRSVTKSGADLKEGDGVQSSEFSNYESEKENQNTNNKNQNTEKLVTFIKSVLGDKISEARTTARLAESPACLSVPENGMEIRFERFMRENKQLAYTTAKIFEINPNHNIIKKLSDECNKDGFENNEIAKNKATETIQLLFDQANIIEGEPVVDIKAFMKKMNRLIEQDLVA